MAKTGLLVLTQPFTRLKSLIPLVIEEASSLVKDTLYVSLQPALVQGHITQQSFLQPLPLTSEVESCVNAFYTTSSNICHTLNVQVLLSNIVSDPSSYVVKTHSLKNEVTLLLSDSQPLKDSWENENATLTTLLKSSFQNVHPNLKFHFLRSVSSPTTPEAANSDRGLKSYPNVVVGGTFDRFHNGHKVLLTTSCLRCDKKLVVGITDGERNKKKSLWELMEPFSKRQKHVIEFVNDVKPDIDLEAVKIFDAFGPTITDPDFQCIVVSEETKGGGKAVNDEREKRSFAPLETVTIDLVEDACRDIHEEDKVSSSSFRKRLLGTFINPVQPRPGIPISPYRIILSGGIASGKSNVSKELQNLGAKIINCDLLGHKAYLKGTPAYHAVVSAFGEDVVGEDGEINRQKLGPIVFGDKNKLNQLNSIVWPSIWQLAEEEIRKFSQEKASVVVLEAAVAFEAGWNNMVHEVWSTFVPREEAVKRLIERNKLSQEEAEKRLDSQLSNEERIERSNVAIYPLWEFEVTRGQVEKAWKLLQDRLKICLLNKL